MLSSSNKITTLQEDDSAGKDLPNSSSSPTLKESAKESKQGETTAELENHLLIG
jgi:hypothetical protein